MAKQATTNTPDADHVKNAVLQIEQQLANLASERGVYMQKCKKIRDVMGQNYDTAVERGISKKLLKTIVKERELERRIDGLTADLEPDERTELEMLVEKLGDFGSLPLGKAAIEAAA